MAQTSADITMRDQTQAGPSAKRQKTEHTLVDPFTGASISASKKPTFQLSPEKKRKVILLLLMGYNKYLVLYFPNDAERQEAHQNLSVCIQITNIIFNQHICMRQKYTKVDSNTRTKSMASDPKVTFKGKEISHPRATVTAIWEGIVKDLGLEYKKYDKDDKDNWLGAAGPYFNIFAGFGLRMNEVRMGHAYMHQTKVDDKVTDIKVSQYGVHGHHHVLMDGCTFPPEKRSSMAQTMGPLTALILLIRSPSSFRNKWEEAVRRAMSHLSIVEDVIAVTKDTSNPAGIAQMVTNVGDILLMTTARQAQRMFLPLSFLYHAYENEPTNEEKEKLIESFNFSNKGGFYVYREARKVQWKLTSNLTQEQAAQVIFHSIFGTYREDFGILSEITNIQNWFSRDDIGDNFKLGKNQAIKGTITFEMPKLKCYSKMASANLSGLLSGVYSQLCAAPVFSGVREVTFSEDFFRALEKTSAAVASGKTLLQVNTALAHLKEQLVKTLQATQGKVDMGTTNWFDTDTMTKEKNG